MEGERKTIMKEILIFHHSDLDGMGVKLLGVKFANKKEIPYRTFKCNYSDINDIVCSTINRTGIDNIEEIIIGDISVSQTVGEYLDKLYQNGLEIRLRDHHETAKYLNKYDWAYVSEVDSEGVPRCGTYILSQDEDIKQCLTLTDLEFVRNVDDWDTWKWTKNGNENATKLNDLFQAMGEDWFTEYMLTSFEGDFSVFNYDTELIIRVQQERVKRTAKRCMKNMYCTDVYIKKYRKSLRAGIIFCGSDISSVCNLVLEECTSIDFLLVVNMPNGISLRTRNNIDISLGEVAKQLTGSGGGHPKSAGGNFNKTQVVQLLRDSTTSLSNGNVKLRKVHHV